VAGTAAAFTCGITLEALNNVVSSTKRLIVVLNDNEWSIRQERRCDLQLPEPAEHQPGTYNKLAPRTWRRSSRASRPALEMKPRL